jgi:hypothetical protein
MTFDEFRQMADARGADMSRWPQAEQARAAVIAQSAEGMAILARAREIDRLIADSAPHVAHDRIDRAAFAVISRLAEVPQARPSLLGLIPRWLVPATGIACAAALGVLIGTIDPVLSGNGSDDMRSVLTMIFDTNSIEQGWISR